MLKNYLKRGAYTTFFYGLSSFFSRGISIFFLPYFLSHLTLIELGIWDFYQMFFSMGTLLLCSCTATPLFRYFFVYQHDEDKQKQVLGTSFITAILLSLIVLVFAYLVSCLMPEQRSYLLITLANISVFPLFSLMLCYLRILDLPSYYALVYCGQALTALALTVVGVFNGFGINSFFYANLFSLSCFLPYFFYLCFKFNYFCLKQWYEQIKYALPLFLHSLLYLLFYSLDKMFLKYYGGYEALGTYALLWRFGSIYQMFGVVLIDVWTFIAFKAYTEKNRRSLFERMIKYYALILCSGTLISVLSSYHGILCIFPQQYLYLVSYVVLFFLPLLLIELGRLIQVVFTLTTRTMYIPCISAITLLVQYSALYWLSFYGLNAVIIANIIAFSCYGLIGYYAGRSIDSEKLVPGTEILKQLMILILYLIVISYCIQYCQLSVGLSIGIVLSWPVALWLVNVFDSLEKERIIQVIKYYRVKPLKRDKTV